MEKYLLLCRSNLSNLSQFKTVSIVIGNESCDLDSAVSAIVLAYVKYHEAQHQQAENDEAVIVLPVLNVPRQDLHLRREVVFWFEQVLHYDLKVLICRDEIDYDQLNASSADIVFSLVDHNENKEQARLLPRGHFEEIIDHHQPTFADGACQVADQSRVLIDTTVGSCCSLVALRFLDCPLVSKFAHQEVNTDEGIALLLYGPILLDTNCFNHAMKRFNAKDYEAVNKLEVLLKYTPDAETSLFDRNEVYQRLVEAKNSLDGLSFEELLRKDMKMVESLTDNNLAICIPGIHGTKLTELSLKDQLDKLKAFSQNPPKSAVFSESRPRLFNAIVLLSVDNRIPNNLNRQLALYCENKLLMRTIATCLERNTELELEMITVSETLRIYNQNNLKATRKAVLPIISTILNGPGTQRTAANDAAHATSLGSHCSVNSAQPSALPNGDCRAAATAAVSATAATASAHPQSTKRQVTFEISTAEVDPDYLMSFKTRTISVPEFEEFIRQHSGHNKPIDAADTKQQQQQQPLDHSSQQQQQPLPDCPNSPENAKRSDSVGSDSLISPPSAPSSLIQQPDSYYGSYIEDSFVGDFVGDYMDPDNDHLQHENILVMDADGQNLVMMNPNEAISHSHEIEFDFDSFGPESIIYAGNVETAANAEKNIANNDTNNTAAPSNGENGHGSHHHHQQQQKQNGEEDEADNDGGGDDDDDAGKETSNGDDRNTSHTANKHDGATVNGAEGKIALPETAPVPAVRTTVQRTTAANTTTTTSTAEENGEESTKAVVVDDESAELIVVADDSAADTSKTDLTTVLHSNGNHTPVSGRETSESVIVEENLSELNIQNGNGTANAAATTTTTLVDEPETARQSSLSPAPGSSFSRNSTLTRSQRKKVTPQVNIIKNMLVASSTYSPPVLDPTSIPSFSSSHDGGTGGAGQLNGDKSDVNENFIISSLAQKQQSDAAAHSEANGDHQHIADHPLSISTSASHNSLSEFGLNGGLTRQPSMKKKVPVNRDILLHNYDKDEEGEKSVSSSDPMSQLNGVPYLKVAPQLENNTLTAAAASAANHSDALPPVHSEDDVQMPADFGESFLNGHGEPCMIDMKAIEPYKKVISHGGYMHASADGRNVEGASSAIIIFSACYMPDRTRKDYHYVMDNLFMYVLTTLHNMIADDYILIYLHNGGQQNSGPTFGWLKRCYQMIDRRLKKNLKGLYILHPTFWLKTIIIMSKPFISSKFSRKLKFVRSLEELREMIPIEHVAIPEPVKIYDQLVTSR